MNAGVQPSGMAKAGASGSTRGGEVGKYLKPKPITQGSHKQPSKGSKGKGY